MLQGRSYREVARAHGVSKSWVGKVVGRFRAGGYEAIEPRSRAPRTIPHRTPIEVEDEIVGLRKELADLGLDAGAHTIHYHLGLRHEQVPSVSTIWRVLSRRGQDGSTLGARGLYALQGHPVGAPIGVESAYLRKGEEIWHSSSAC